MRAVKESMSANDTPTTVSLANMWTKELKSRVASQGHQGEEHWACEQKRKKLTVTRSGNLGSRCAETYKVSRTVVGMEAFGVRRVQAEVFDSWIGVGLFGIDGSRTFTC